jgi:hypothetical protein
MLRVGRMVKRVGVMGSDSVASDWKRLRYGIVGIAEEGCGGGVWCGKCDKLSFPMFLHC